ncbi:MAG: DoxX family protein, partial [Rhodanobacteraceae bacterium]
LKAAGVAGLLLGLLGFHVVGAAAAAGLVVFFIGAMIAHMRARVFYNIAFPGLYLALAAASLAFSMSQ